MRLREETLFAKTRKITKQLVSCHELTSVLITRIGKFLFSSRRDSEAVSQDDTRVIMAFAEESFNCLWISSAKALTRYWFGYSYFCYSFTWGVDRIERCYHESGVLSPEYHHGVLRDIW